MALEPDVAVAALDLDCADPDTMQVKAILRIRVAGYAQATVELVCDFVVVSPCPPGTSMRVIVVQPGDTLWKLSRQFGTTIEEIVKLNNIENPDLIFPGQRLRIPCVPVAAPAPVPIVGRG
jgi:LysM repeat protein